MIILVHHIDPATLRAIAYVHSVRPSDIAAVAFDDKVAGPWRELAPDIEISVLGPRRSRAASLRAFLRARRTQLRPEDFLTLIVPEMLKSPGLFELIARPGIHRLKASLLREDNVQVLNVPVVEQTSPEDDDDPAREPARNFVCILVSGVHNATLQAVEYAETLQAADIRAVTFGLDPDETERLSNDWLSAGIPHALEVEDSPFRDIATSLTHYVRQFNPDGIHRVVTVVIPEFVVKKQRHQILHGQTALLVKRRLLFEEGVVVVSVPYRLED